MGSEHSAEIRERAARQNMHRPVQVSQLNVMPTRPKGGSPTSPALIECYAAGIAVAHVTKDIAAVYGGEVDRRLSLTSGLRCPMLSPPPRESNHALEYTARCCAVCVCRDRSSSDYRHGNLQRWFELVWHQPQRRLSRSRRCQGVRRSGAVRVGSNSGNQHCGHAARRGLTADNLASTWRRKRPSVGKYGQQSLPLSRRPLLWEDEEGDLYE